MAESIFGLLKSLKMPPLIAIKASASGRLLENERNEELAFQTFTLVLTG